MRSRYLTVFTAAIIFFSCHGQSGSKPTIVFNKDFHWKIEIPPGFESVPAEEWMKLQNRGTAAIEKTYEGKVENNAKTIFVFKSDQFNYFESNWQPFDSTTDGNYLESFGSVNKIVYTTFETQMPMAKLDSASSQETIDGKLFQVFRTTITIPGKIVLESRMYSRLFGKREFTVNIMTVDKEKQRMLLNAWKNSTFSAK